MERAVRAAARHGVDFLTIHAGGGAAMIRAAAEAAAESEKPPAILAVTVLTSLDDADLSEMGLSASAGEQALRLARLAVRNGADGLVCSPREVAVFRRALGPTPLLVTPGIRPSGSAAGDQKRIATPADAVAGGATHLVVGRPILQAPDPAAAARRILDEIREAPSPPMT